MNIPVSSQQRELHALAVNLCGQREKLELDVVEVLQRIDATKTYKAMGAASLFQYCLTFLNLSEAVAYNFISVVRASERVPHLKAAIQKQEISIYKAGRIAAVLELGNAAELIQYAGCHSTREIEAELARRNPKRAKRERARAISEDQVEIKFTISKAEYEELLRARELMAQKTGANCEISGTVTTAVKEFVERHDPVRRAQRAQKRDAAGAESQENKP